ncbi:MAG: iron ABC transporter permease [Bdellovibrionales bacterium]|nr:iron ABC transporter permease [Bdellovibrionales bacterium]
MNTEYWISIALNTLGVMGGVTLFSAILALPLAWLLERSDLPAKNFFGRLFIMPYAIPSFLMAISWITLANPSVGWINLLAHSLTGRDEPVASIYHLGGIIFVETSCVFSILLVSFRAGLKKLDPTFEEAARLAGAKPWRVFFSISIPLLKGPLFAGLVSVALASLASFGVPAMIGGPARVFVLTTGLYGLIKEGSPQALQQALLISGVVAIAALGLSIVAQRALGQQAAIVTGKAARPSLVSLGRGRAPLILLLSILVFVLVILPGAALIAASFQIQPGSFAREAWGFDAWKRVLLELPDFYTALRNSATASLLAALCIVVVAVVVEVLGRASRLRKHVEGASLLLYSLPGTVLALLLILTTSFVPGGRWLANGLGILVLAYALKYLMLGLRNVGSAVELVHSSLIEAARLAGAGRWQLLRRIWIPLLKSALMAAAVLCLVPCLSELTMSVLLYGPGTENLGVLLFQLHDYADRSSAAVVGTLVFVAVFALQWAVAQLRTRSSSA